MKTVAIQGINGSFHGQAADLMLPDNIRLECNTFEDVFYAVKNAAADYGVAAIENNLHGPISSVYRLLNRSGLWVCGETTLHIEQFLFGIEDKTVEELNTSNTVVHSQVMALAQCEHWLSEHLPLARREETQDTAASVMQIMQDKKPYHLAIASKNAGEIYGAARVAGPINDDPTNSTRFLLLQKERPAILEPFDTSETKGARTLIILTTNNTEGSLYRALGAFADEHINLSKLDSHPIPGDQRHYAFYIDLEAGLNSAKVQRALSVLSIQKCEVGVLGSYDL